MTEMTDKPLFNVRWGYAIAFFIAPPTLVGFDEGGPDLAVVGLVLGLAFVAYIAILDWSIETDHWIGDYTFVAIITALVYLVVAVVGLAVVELFGVVGVLVCVVIAYLCTVYALVGWLR